MVKKESPGKDLKLFGKVNIANQVAAEEKLQSEGGRASAFLRGAVFEGKEEEPLPGLNESMSIAVEMEPSRERKESSRVEILTPLKCTPYRKEFERERMGIQWNRGGGPLRSGAMTGCHLVIGINPHRPSEQFMSHDNPAMELYETVHPKMLEHPDWCYYLLFTEKTMRDFVFKGKDLDDFVSRVEKSMCFDQKALKAFYLDDSNMDRIEVEFHPKNLEIQVHGIDEITRTAHTFKAVIDLPSSQKADDVAAFQQYLRDRFKNESSSDFQALCNARDLVEMKKIACKYVRQSSSSHNLALQRVCKIIADDRFASIFSIKNEILAIKDSPQVQEKETSCSIM
ncbi:MAG TPA: hypothetical protein DCE71_00625 [Parachlamydiales bacterium]|nr:hypothetical protein [Parachlamydiales bacterium]